MYWGKRTCGYFWNKELSCPGAALFFYMVFLRSAGVGILAVAVGGSLSVCPHVSLVKQPRGSVSADCPPGVDPAFGLLS